MANPSSRGLGLAASFLGPPGAGKGTQARKIAKFYGVPHISTGEMLREDIERGTPLGLRAKPFMDTGELVPDDVVLNMVEERIGRDDCSQGFILDGFPRTLPQAEKFDAILRTHGQGEPLVVHFVVDTSLLLRRLTGRRTCVVGGEIYNIYDHPPKVPGRCDVDGGELVQRPDDSEEVIEGRLDTYLAHTSMLVDYYRRRDDLVEVDGNAPPAVVTERLVKVLGPAR